jgi:hypothetical protein
MRSLPADDMWVVTECAEAALGALRRTQRVVAWATVLAQRPGASLPEACGARATLKAASRFFDHAALAPRNLLDSHVDATLGRLASVPLVLAVQDTTALDGTAHPATTGLGALGTRPSAACPCTPRGRSRPRRGPGACGPNRCGLATPTPWGSVPPASSARLPSRQGSRG